MNKTININLANLFFHIDEEAYSKLQGYLEAIRRSFANTSGSDEILADIEARIAELFQEKMVNERQVITQKEVDEVIAIMGQPEDYLVDEDIFEDRPISSQQEKRVKKLYRDIENKYIGGVSSGLGHYFRIDALWVRILWVFLTIFSSGAFIFIYVLLWILIPEAVTTAQKLDMSGETVNISTIEKKVKEGFDGVAEKVKNVDYEKVGNRVKSGSKGFFNTLADVIMFLFKVFGKLIGILLIITGATGIVSLFIGLFTVGILDIMHIPGIEYYYLINSTNVPVWLASLLLFFVVGIPFFFLMYLGLKILVNNLKSIGNIAKFSLLGLWLISLILLAVFGIRQAAVHAYSGNVAVEKVLAFQEPDQPITIRLKSSNWREKGNNLGFNGIVLDYTESGEEVLVFDDLRVHIKKSKDSLAYMEIRKGANGSSYRNATETADEINYAYVVEGNSLVLDDFLTTAKENKYRNQKVSITLSLPMGTKLLFDKISKRCWMLRANNDRDMNGCDLSGYLWTMTETGELVCQDCPEINSTSPTDDGDGKIIINSDGVDIDIKDGEDSFKLKIDKQGVQIKTNEKKSNTTGLDTVQ